MVGDILISELDEYEMFNMNVKNLPFLGALTLNIFDLSNNVS